MNKSGLITAISNKLGGVPEQSITLCVDATIDTISDALLANRRVEIRNFGNFSLRLHPPRSTRNPKTGDTFMSKERKVVYFKPGKALKERVNKKD